MTDLKTIVRSPFDWETGDGWKMSGSLWLPDPTSLGPVDDRRLPVVLVHGLGEHAGRYDRFANGLTSMGHHVYAMDLRGHGLSEGVRGDTPSLLHLVDDLRVFVNLVQQQRQSPVLMVAHSMGGLLATLFALKHPDRLAGLFLISPYYRPAFEPKWWRLAFGHFFYSVYPGLTLNVGLQLPHLAKDEQVRRSIVNDPLSHQRLSARWAIDALRIGRNVPLMRKKLLVPTTIVHGDADRVSSIVASKFFALHQNQLWDEGVDQSRIDFENQPGGFHQIHNDRDSRQQVLAAFARLRDRVNAKHD